MLALAIAAIMAAPSPDRCAALAAITLRRAVVTDAAIVDDGICKVEGVARPAAGSHIRFQLRLPRPERWSGRYYQIGNGGFAGAIHEPTLAEGAARGDAIAATDTGHQGDGFDASWAMGHPVQIDDYGWRSIKATSDAARAVLAHYYDRPASRYYMIGCSNGGRMALMAAARWPDEWDGVIAGAPANPWGAQLRSFADLQQRLRRDPESWIDPSLLPQIRDAALAGCRPGAIHDGIAQEPYACSTDFSKLGCDGAGHCLTASQAASLEAIVRAGYLPAAMVPDDWQRWILASPQTQSQLTLGMQADDALSNADAALDVPATGLVHFGRRGGRILSYFGWADAVIAPMRGVDWYRAVAKQSNRAADVQAYYRLFMVPGMAHCQGGIGATQFGQSIDTPGLSDDATHDVRRALEAWVEHGQAPRILIASDKSGAKTQILRPLDP